MQLQRREMLWHVFACTSDHGVSWDKGSFFTEAVNGMQGASSSLVKMLLTAWLDPQMGMVTVALTETAGREDTPVSFPAGPSETYALILNATLHLNSISTALGLPSRASAKNRIIIDHFIPCVNLEPEHF